MTLDPKKEKKRQRAIAAGEKYGHPAKLEPNDLPRWARLALARHVTLGESLKDAAKQFGRSERTLQNSAYSPAGRKWMAMVEAAAEDPLRMATALLQASTMQVTMEYLQAFQQAIDAQDYREVGVMARDVLDRMGMTKKDKGSGGAAKPTIVINLGSGVNLDAPMVESSYEATVEEADWSLETDEGADD